MWLVGPGFDAVMIDVPVVAEYYFADPELVWC